MIYHKNTNKTPQKHQTKYHKNTKRFPRNYKQNTSKT